MGKKSGGRVRVKQMGGPKMPMNPLADLAIPPEEMIHLPKKPDSNSGIMVWPLGETFTMNYKNFCAIYPNYLDSNKTIKLGRKIAENDALPEPTILDIHEALVSMRVRHAIQPHKGYSRDAMSRWDNPGRAMVDLEGIIENRAIDVKSDGAFDDIPDMPDTDGVQVCKENKDWGGKGKKQLLRQLAKTIQDLPNRQKRCDEKIQQLKEEKLKTVLVEKVATKSTKTGGPNICSGNRKKKGKRKK